MIRTIMPSDISQLVHLAEIMHGEGRYKNKKFNPEKLKKHFFYLMSGNFLGFADDKDGKIVGAILGVVTDYFFGDDLMLQDCGFFVLPEHRKGKSGSKLLSAFVSAGKQIKVKEIMLMTSSLKDANALDFLCKKVGLEKAGSIYKMEII